MGLLQRYWLIYAVTLQRRRWRDRVLSRAVRTTHDDGLHRSDASACLRMPARCRAQCGTVMWWEARALTQASDMTGHRGQRYGTLGHSQRFGCIFGCIFSSIQIRFFCVSTCTLGEILSALTHVPQPVFQPVKDLDRWS